MARFRRRGRGRRMFRSFRGRRGYPGRRRGGRNFGRRRRRAGVRRYMVIGNRM